MTSSLHIDALAERLFRKQRHALEPEEENVLRGIQHGVPISRDAADVSDEQSTYGERLSDRVAAIGGSWGFIIAFALVLFGWMILNTDVLAHFNLAFDPYPYIFLNLMLSTLAAVQAPIILMSQNRQAAKDRVAASLDFEVICGLNLKSCGCMKRSTWRSSKSSRVSSPNSIRVLHRRIKTRVINQLWRKASVVTAKSRLNRPARKIRSAQSS